MPPARPFHTDSAAAVFHRDVMCRRLRGLPRELTWGELRQLALEPCRFCTGYLWRAQSTYQSRGGFFDDVQRGIINDIGRLRRLNAAVFDGSARSTWRSVAMPSNPETVSRAEHPVAQPEEDVADEPQLDLTDAQLYPDYSWSPPTRNRGAAWEPDAEPSPLTPKRRRLV